MSKILGFVLLLIGAVVLVPPLRERVRPHVQFAFDPFYTWSAKNEVKELHDMVHGEQQLGRAIPSARDFPGFVDRTAFKEDASTDPWGNKYYLKVTRATFQVGSRGKDGRAGTEDDILSEPEALSTASTRRRR